MSIQLKVCGMKNKQNIQELLSVQPDYIGFIFHEKSPRFVEPEIDVEYVKKLPVKATGVFVNARFEYIDQQVKKYNLKAVQLHGRETPELSAKVKLMLKVEVIKAFAVDETFNFNETDDYDGACDYYLFDTKTPKFGGSGKKFDWGILNKYYGNKPYFLSGGIDVEDAKSISELTSGPLYAIDINSRFETEPAMKDMDKINRFVKALRA